MALACACLCAGLSGCAAAAPPRTAAPVAVPAPEPGPAIAPAVAANPTAALRGAVVSRIDRTPLAHARVIATSTALSEPRVAITGADGTFAFTSLPGGAYSVSITRTGYAPAHIGEHPAATVAPIAIAVGQTVNGLEVALQPAGVIAGQLLDEDDEPLAGGTVDALVTRTADGRTAFVSIASTQTDDRGEFRLTGVPAGQFYVSACDPAAARAGDETGGLPYAPTYYPGVSFAEQATRVPVTPGAEPQRIVFKLHLVRPALVSGRIRTPQAHQLVSGAVIMRPMYAQAPVGAPGQDVTILPDGTFAFRNVPPGQYEIRARGNIADRDASLFSAFQVRVNGQDIGNIEMMLQPGAHIEGRVIIDAAKTERRREGFNGVRVRAPLVDGGSFGDALTGIVRADGAYTIGDVMPGHRMIAVDGLTDPWIVRSVTWRGRDITDTGIAAESRGIYSDVRVMITDAASEVSGVVRDAKGMAVAGATVLIIPTSSQFWTRTSRRFRILHADAAGRYSVRGLPPGGYRALASVEIADSEALRPEVLQELAQAGHPLDVTDLASLSVDLRLTPALKIPHLTAR